MTFAISTIHTVMRINGFLNMNWIDLPTFVAWCIFGWPYQVTNLFQVEHFMTSEFLEFSKKAWEFGSFLILISGHRETRGKSERNWMEATARTQSHSTTSNSCIAGKLAVCGKQMRSAKSFHRPTLCIQHEFGLNMSLSLIMVPWKRQYALRHSSQILPMHQENWQNMKTCWLI